MAKTALNNQGSSPCHLRSPWRLPKMRASPWSLPTHANAVSPTKSLIDQFLQPLLGDFQGPHSQEPSGRQQHQTLKAHLRKPGSNWANKTNHWMVMNKTPLACPIWVLRSVAAAMVRKLFSRVMVAEQMTGGESFIMLGTPKNIQYKFLPST